MHQFRVWFHREPLCARHDAIKDPNADAPVCWDHRVLAYPEAATCCSCGIYAYNTPERMVEQLRSTYTGDALVCVGAVALWGIVFCHENGYRAQYACPQEPLIVFGPEQQSRDVAAALSQSYGVRFLTGSDPAVRHDRQARRLLTACRRSGAVRLPLQAAAPVRWLARLVAAPAAVYRHLESSRRTSA